jgi:glycosyltransferase involved in cell wall biosynthesis
MPWPKISVITVSYNQAEYLEQTLQSVLDQGYPNLEYIVIDGSSTDGSVQILERYASSFAYWVSEPDEGQTDGLIKGFQKATGDIECWLNSDDLFEPGALQAVAAFFGHHPDANVVYGDSIWIDRNGSPIRPKHEHAFNRFIWTYDHNYIPQPSTFWRRTLYEHVGGLDPAFNLAMDADLWMRFAAVSRLHHIPIVLSRIRTYPEQKNQRLRADSDREDWVIRERFVGPISPGTRKVKKVAAKTMRIAWKLAVGAYWWNRRPWGTPAGHP